ncbi:hypothetical protein [Acrocarpospora catenulata]|uniref:hypothetical protein n=1 Tax=Acrocarpospora catenulata TaxID=2836182 RepID=UPI001BDAB53C|nr:hypothetical protein [Acrocarpospora catenulata]
MSTLVTVILVVVLVVSVVPVAFIIVGMSQSGARQRARLAQRTPNPMPMPPDVQEQARDLYLTNIQANKVEALRLIRAHTGVGLREAQMIANALAAGLPMPGGRAGQLNDDLATRARALKAAGRTEQAVFLVRGETGMDQSAAEAFIDAL